MFATNVTPLYSKSLNDLRRLLQEMQPPYSLRDIQTFNGVYRVVYPSLNREEKRRAEDLVDSLIAGLERREWASKIYGVV